MFVPRSTSVLVPLLLVPTLFACAPAATQAGEGDHDHDAAFQVTVWGVHHELFAEHPAPIAGETMELLTHVTELAAGAPRATGPITVHARGPADAHVEATSPAPDAPGIYRTELTFPGAGAWQLEAVIPGRDSLPEERIALTEVFVHAPGSTPHAHPPTVDGIAFLKEQQWRLGTRVAPVESRPLVEHFDAPGKVRPIPSRRALVSPGVAGRLGPPPSPDGGDAATLPPIGTEVERGQVLGVVVPPFSDLTVRLQEAAADAARAALEVERAELVLARTRRLFEDGARSQRELEENEFALRLAEADLAAADAVIATLEVSGVDLVRDPGGGPLTFRLTAPISGHVHGIDAVAGEYVTPDRTVLEVVDTDRLLVEVAVPAAQADRIAPGRNPRFTLLGSPELHSAPPPAELEDARLLIVEERIDPVAGTVPVLFDVANPGGALRIGQRLRVELETGAPRTVPAIPVSSLVDEDGRPVAFVQLAGETFERRHLTLGVRDGAWVEVVDGVAPGERVVVEGGYAVRLAAAAGQAPGHGHAH